MKVTCKVCKRLAEHHAKGLCCSCYQKGCRMTKKGREHMKRKNLRNKANGYYQPRPSRRINDIIIAAIKGRDVRSVKSGVADIKILTKEIEKLSK